MTRSLICLIAILPFIVGACSKETGQEGSQTMAPKASSPAPAKQAAATAASGRVIDHAKDAKEFRIRRSLAGVESLIEDYKAAGHSTDKLEAQREKLQKKLAEITGG